jgi:hypothetical protein
MIINHNAMKQKIQNFLFALLLISGMSGCGWVQDRRTYSLEDTYSVTDNTDAGAQEAGVPADAATQATTTETQPQTQTQPDNPDAQATPAETQTQQEEVITFDLPTGWARDEDNSSNRAIRWHETADGVKPYVLMEVNVGRQGTKEEAQQYALQDNIKRLQGCREAPCEYLPGYEERNIAGVDVFISTDTGHYWGAESYYSEIAFSKDNRLYYISLDDLVANQEDAVATVIRTIHLATM